MNKSVLLQLGVFVLVLLALNFFLHWHISILGSVLITIVLNVILRLFQSNS